jgi:hypothetical protein
MDWSLTSCCSPPRLAATQLQSVTGDERSPGGDSHPSDLLRSRAHDRRHLGGPLGPPPRARPCPLEVIVRWPGTSGKSMAELLDGPAGRATRRSKEEVDAYVEAERSSWE